MKKVIGNFKNINSKYKTIISELKSIALFAFLAIIASVLILISVKYVGWLQNLFLGLGTGAATSALVSIVFYLNDKQIKIREQINCRDIFMYEFKILYRNIIYSINFDYSKGATLDFETYVKKQHRWYHEYYKRMIADNYTDIETKARKECLEEFVSLNLPRFEQIFEYSSEWKKGNYTSWQKTELLNFYNEFKSIQIHLERNNYKASFFEFSYLLERIKRLCGEFLELRNFNFLKFEYDNKGNMRIEDTIFEEKEPDFKFAREFQDIRNKNYVKYYSKEVLNNEIKTRDKK